jgi:hypothetical protein
MAIELYTDLDRVITASVRILNQHFFIDLGRTKYPFSGTIFITFL